MNDLKKEMQLRQEVWELEVWGPLTWKSARTKSSSFEVQSDIGHPPVKTAGRAA